MKKIKASVNTQSLSWEILLLTYIGRLRGETSEREEAEKQHREEKERREAKRVETPQSTEEEVAEKLRGVKVKWTQRVEERPVHLKHNPGTRKDT